MAVISYLVYPVEGHLQTLSDELQAHPYCEVLPAENAEILILVTDTPDKEAEKETHIYLKENEYLQCLAMVHGQLADEPQSDTHDTIEGG